MSLRLLWDSIKGLCQVSVHREGVNPSSMEGVHDLRDHISVPEIFRELLPEFYRELLPEHKKYPFRELLPEIFRELLPEIFRELLPETTT